MWWNSGKVMVERWNGDGRTVLAAQCWWKSVVKQRNSDGGTALVEQ